MTLVVKFKESSGEEIVINDLHLVHIQDEASNTWTIDHSLNKYPSVTVVDDEGNVIVGEVHYISKAQIVITFSTAITGRVFCN